MKKMLVVLLLLPLLAACGQARNPLGVWISEYDKATILSIDEDGDCALITDNLDNVFACSYKKDNKDANNIKLTIGILGSNYTVNAVYDKSKDVLNVSYGNDKNVFYRNGSADAKKISDNAVEDKDISGIILKAASKKNIKDIKVSASSNQEFPIEIHNTGPRINDAIDFLDKYSSSMTSIGNYLQTCSKSVDSPTGDLTKLNQCKKDTALKLQELVDLQGPSANAAKEKTMDGLIVEYNDLIQSIKSTMTNDDLSGFSQKISTWQKKMTAAITAYVS